MWPSLFDIDNRIGNTRFPLHISESNFDHYFTPRWGLQDPRPTSLRLRLSVNSAESQFQVWLTWVLVWLKKQLIWKRNLGAHRRWSLPIPLSKTFPSASPLKPPPFLHRPGQTLTPTPSRDKVVEHFLSSSGTIDMIWSTLPVDNSAKIQGPASSDDYNNLTLLQITSSSNMLM